MRHCWDTVHVARTEEKILSYTRNPSFFAPYLASGLKHILKPNLSPRGPAKGYIEGLEHRLHEAESLLLALLPLVTTEQLKCATNSLSTISASTANTNTNTNTAGGVGIKSNSSSRDSQSPAPRSTIRSNRPVLNKKTGIEYWESFPLDTVNNIRRWQQDCSGTSTHLAGSSAHPQTTAAEKATVTTTTTSTPTSSSLMSLLSPTQPQPVSLVNHASSGTNALSTPGSVDPNLDDPSRGQETHQTTTSFQNAPPLHSPSTDTLDRRRRSSSRSSTTSGPNTNTASNNGSGSSHQQPQQERRDSHHLYPGIHRPPMIRSPSTVSIRNGSSTPKSASISISTASPLSSSTRQQQPTQQDQNQSQSQSQSHSHHHPTTTSTTSWIETVQSDSQPRTYGETGLQTEAATGTKIGTGTKATVDAAAAAGVTATDTPTHIDTVMDATTAATGIPSAVVRPGPADSEPEPMDLDTTTTARFFTSDLQRRLFW
ncbi:hypothetical protein HRR88_008282 [Exophiala dermatitidis]|nr:hypothetical protein HRR74_007672 [Exophiala dermatitidis]KAJ4533276.1 hypothetical protein HRR77_008807 [Exophiala dermatitidis]KAJ4613452.1 hypothetical protein HRR88_008282 [Exophiala dermatitidis]